MREPEHPGDEGGRANGREYPPHGTIYRPSGRIGNFWWMVPVIVVAAVVLGLAVPTSVDLLGFEDGPTALLEALGWKRIRLAKQALTGAYLLCALIPGFLVGFVAGSSSALAHTRSRVASIAACAGAVLVGGAVVLLGLAALQERLACASMNEDPVPSNIECLGRVLADPILVGRLLGPWQYYDVALFMLAAIAFPAAAASRLDHWVLYDEVAGGWYGKPVRIAGALGTVEGHYTADTLRSPPDRSDDRTAPWVKLYLHPSPAAAAGAGPARQLVSAVRISYKDKRKGNAKPVRSIEMPPTFVDQAVIEALIARSKCG